MMCPHGPGGKGIKAVRTFCGQGGRGPIICDFVRTYVMDDPN